MSAPQPAPQPLPPVNPESRPRNAPGKPWSGPVWLPVPVGLVLAILVTLVWQALSAEQRRQGEMLLNTAAANVDAEIVARMETRLQALQRMAQRTAYHPDFQPAEWAADAQLYIQSYPELEAVEWVEPELRLHAGTPPQHLLSPLHGRVLADPQQQNLMRQARDTRRPALTTLRVPGENGELIVAVFPMYRKDEFGGLIVGVFRGRELLDRIVKNVASGYALSVSVDGEEMYSRPTPGGPRQGQPRAERALHFYSTIWRLAVYSGVPAEPAFGSVGWHWPGAQLSSRRSTPEVVLALWLLMSALVSGAVYLAQQARGRSRQFQAANLLLETQIEQRRRGEQQLTRLNRSLRALTECNQVLVHATDEQRLLQDICQILVEHCGYLLAWVGYAEADENKTVRVAAVAGAAKDYMQTGMVTWADVERGRGPTGTAIRTARPTVCHDTLTDPSFLPWRERALQRGFRSCVALPLLLADKPIGALSLYAPIAAAFDAPEVALLSELAQDLTFGIQTLRTRAEHDRAEERLHYLASIVEDSEDAIYSKGLDGTIVTWNRGAEKMYGYTAAEAIARKVSFLAPPERPDETLELLQKIAAGQTIEHYETVRVCKDGTRRDVSLTISPLHDRQGQVVGASSIAHDITERKQAERRLYDQQFYTRSLIEASLDPLMTTDAAGIITDVNQQMELLTGCARAELIGSEFKQYCTEPERAEGGIRRVLREGKLTDYELTVRSRDGRETVVSYNATIYRDWEGNVAGVFAAARDIAERQRAERQLRRASLYARNLIEASLDPLVTISKNGRIMDVNQATELVTGVGRERLIGADFCDYFTDPAKAREGYQQVFARGLVRDYPLAIRHVSGAVTEVLYNAVVFQDESGHTEGVFAAARDITERKQAEQELQRYTAELARSNAELQDFASIASHDLQEPLRKVMAFGDRLEEHCGPRLDDQGRDFLDRMQNAAGRMSSLINALLEYSRVSSRAQPFQPVDLQQVALEVLADLETSIQQARAQIALGILPRLVADRTQMRQLLQNLLSNAVKFHPPGAAPKVWIDSRELEHGGWEIRVRDNGIGFEPNHLERIFRPFQRLHGRSEFAGSGMGLAICRKIVARHGGTLTASSQPGQGATFLVTLPSVAEERKTSWNSPSNPSASCSPKTMTTITS